MKRKPLNETNPYLRNKNLYAKLVTVNVSSSSAIEIGVVSPSIVKAMENKSSPQLIFYPPDQI